MIQRVLLRYYTRVSGRLTAVGRSPACKSNPLYTTMFWMFQYTAKQPSGEVDTSTLVKREDSPQHMDMLNLCAGVQRSKLLQKF